jgi:DNA-binding PadR family transcriptional regulator
MPKTGRNLWMLTVLSLLDQHSMHPYEMLRLIRERRKDMFLNLKGGSLYHAITVLARDTLIEATDTTRDGRRPERTTYRITRDGRLELQRWIRDLLADPAHGQMSFFAAISFLPNVKPEFAALELRKRAQLLDEAISHSRRALSELTPKIGRIVLLELEYDCAVKDAELKWTRSLIEDLEAKTIGWDPKILRKYAGKTPESSS